MGKGCVLKALIVLAFVLVLCTAGCYDGPKWEMGSRETDSHQGEAFYRTTGMNFVVEEAEAENAVTQMTIEQTRITDLTDAFDVILSGATKEFIAGYLIDRSFLMWLNAKYGDEVILNTAYCILDQAMDVDKWYELTGSSIHVLWLRYCQDTGFQNYQLNEVYWNECQSAKEIVISFTGDFNFAEDWYTTEYMQRQPNGIYDCFSEDLLEEMNASDILLMNNEFVYSDRGTALSGKAYTFRANPERVDLLDVFGTDIVSLANNHVFDYGEIGLFDTMDYLEQAGIPYLGAGRNEKEASKIVYFVANGRKIAIVSATEIERSAKYTREATETECGVLKTLKPEKFVRMMEQAEKTSDYVIAVVHWGTEGSLDSDASQRRLAEKFVAAGADAVIGGHPHRLQGAEFIGKVPVAYSLGNFWFSDGTLYTTLAQIVISADGDLRLKYLPCIQKDLKTSLITESGEKDEFYQYLAAISEDIGIDREGNVYNKYAADYPKERVRYDSDKSSTLIRGMTDNEGYAIDIVGNRK